MFEGLKDMGKLMKQASEMKAKMKRVQEELKKVRVSGTSEGGKIEIALSGELECLDVSIDPSLIVAGNTSLEKSVMKAFNDAARKAKELATSKLSDISGGLNLPGL